MVNQNELAAILGQRAALAKAKESLDAAEDALLKRLKRREKVEPGTFRAEVKRWERRDVSWKAVVIREKGQEYADRVLASTRPKKYTALVVEVAA
jgi:hypothetical protein